LTEDHERAREEQLLADAGALSFLWCRLALETRTPPQAVDALYVHGVSAGMIESCGLLKNAAKAIIAGDAKFLSYNGSDGRGAGESSLPKSGWDGEEEYRTEFISSGVPAKLLVPTRAGLHTRDETDAFVELAKEKGWTSALIGTTPFHWPRVLSCLVGSMAKFDHQMKVWFLYPETRVSWYQEMVGSQGTERNSTFRAEAFGDAKRLFQYWEKGRGNGGTAWVEHFGAPPEEIDRYLDWRDRCA